MANKTSNSIIWQTLPLSLTASRFTSMTSGLGEKQLMAYFNKPLSNICTAAWNRNTQHKTCPFLKLSTLLFLFVTACKAQDPNGSSVSLRGVCSYHISQIITNPRNKSLSCQNSVKYFTVFR